MVKPVLIFIVQVTGSALMVLYGLFIYFCWYDKLYGYHTCLSKTDFLSLTKDIAMNIIELRLLKGPNYWSNYRDRLVFMKLDIGQYEELPTNKMEGFYDRIIEVMPGLMEHECSYGERGGFLKRILEGTWAGHVIEHIALELQTAAGLSTGYGRTRSTAAPGIYNIVFSYEEEEAGLLAVSLAIVTFIDIADQKVRIEDIKERIADKIFRVKASALSTRLGPSTSSIVNEAVSRNIPFIRLDNMSFVQLGYGSKQKRIRATVTENTGILSTDLAHDKSLTNRMLSEMGVPTPRGCLVRDMKELAEAATTLGYPLVVKPSNSNHGKGVTTAIMKFDDLLLAFGEAREISERVLVEKYISGRDFRALVINGKFVALCERIPANVTGDGKSSVSTLIELENRHPFRGEDHENFLSKIRIDKQTMRLLGKKKYTLDSVLYEGETFYLKSTANLSSGGTAIDRTDEVHPDNILIFERVASIIGLDVAGIDVIADDISVSIMENGGSILEVNSCPGFRMHLSPTIGKPRNVARHVVDMLFPDNCDGRIPVIAVTGTNGKTTTTRLISHILALTGKRISYTTTDGIYNNGCRIMKGDMTGPISARLVLKDPTVDIAVLETARGGILREGLGYDKCDIGVIMNVQSDHLGLKDIHTLEDMAEVKSVVAKSVSENGYSVLNADDSLVAAMKDVVSSKTAFFSMDAGNKYILENPISCCLLDNHIIIKDHDFIYDIVDIRNLEFTFQGRAECMIQNALASVLSVYLYGLDLNMIRQGLSSFSTAVTSTPGRLNYIEMGRYHVLIDYAHNPAGFYALRDLIQKMDHTRVTGVFGGTGDRRDEDIKLLGEIGATMFDSIVIKERHFRRGRMPGVMTGLIMEGIRKINMNLPVSVIESDYESAHYALENAIDGELIVILGGDLNEILEIIESHKHVSVH